MIAATLAGVADWRGFRLPAVGWLFDGTREMDLMMPADWYPGGELPWLGWLGNIVVWIAGAWLVASFSGGTKFRPLTLRRMQRFREIKRGYWSLVILVVLGFMASLDFVLVGSEGLGGEVSGRLELSCFFQHHRKRGVLWARG